MAQLIDITEEPKKLYKLSKQGTYVLFFFNTSGKVIVELAHPGVNVNIFGLFIGRNDETFVIETIQHHTAPTAISNLLIKGVFYDNSKFDYKGLIRIEKEGQQSHAYQKNQNLILSQNAYVQSKPYLEILANDVFCTHGSTTGKLNNEQLFYLGTRGIDTEKAKKLLIDGFVREIEDKIKQFIPDFSLNKYTKNIDN